MMDLVAVIRTDHVQAGEMQSPRRNLPKAAKRYFYRLIGFYVLGVLAIGVVRSNPSKHECDFADQCQPDVS